jgi:hypothetical protein
VQEVQEAQEVEKNTLKYVDLDIDITYLLHDIET